MLESYLHLRLQRTQKYSWFRLRSDNVLHHTATALAAIPCWLLPFVHEWLVHSSIPSFDRQHHLAMPLYTADRLTAKPLTMWADHRSNHQRDSKWCTITLNRMRQHLMWAVVEKKISFRKLISEFVAIRVKRLVFILTSMPMSVGRKYKLADSVCGTHSWSIDTNRFMQLISSSPSNVGNPERLADKFIRFIFIFGRKIRIRPSTPL